MPKFIVSAHHRAGYYDGARLYKPGETVEIDPSEYGTKLPREGGLADYSPLMPTDREGAVALGWHPQRVDAVFPRLQSEGRAKVLVPKRLKEADDAGAVPLDASDDLNRRNDR